MAQTVQYSVLFSWISGVYLGSHIESDKILKVFSTARYGPPHSTEGKGIVVAAVPKYCSHRQAPSPHVHTNTSIA